MSDTEEVIVISDSEEENDPSLEPPAFRTPYSTPAFQTPYGTPFTPNTGIVFWGSPYDDQENVQKVPNKKVVTCDSVRSPFIQRENFFTPFGEENHLYTVIILFYQSQPLPVYVKTYCVNYLLTIRPLTHCIL